MNLICIGLVNHLRLNELKLIENDVCCGSRIRDEVDQKIFKSMIAAFATLLSLAFQRIYFSH